MAQNETALSKDPAKVVSFNSSVHRLSTVLSIDSEREVESIFNAQDRVEIGLGQR